MFSRGRKTLKFNYLHGDKWAAFLRPAFHGGPQRIVFPQNFQPKDGVRHEVEIWETSAGEFIYRDTTYRVCRAELVSAADVVDQIEHRFAQRKSKAGQPTELALALERARG